MSSDDGFDPLVQGGESDIEPEITDPDEMLQHRRLREIEDARQAVQDRAENAHGRWSDGQIAYHTAVDVFYNALLSYYEELQGLMLTEQRELGKEYLTDYELGEMVIHPPADMTADADPSPFNGYKEVLEPPEPEEVTFDGFQDIVQSGSTVSATFEARVRTRDDGEHQDIQTKSIPVDWKILRNGYQALIEFAGKAGLDVRYNKEIDVEADPF